MKTLKSILLLSLLIAILAGCEKSNEEFLPDDPQSLKYGSNVDDGVKTVTLPFELSFLGESVAVYFPGDENYNCDPLYACRCIADAVGTGTHLGKFTATFDFCAGGPDDPNVEGRDFQYAPNETTLVAANGDLLFVFSQGTVIVGRTEDHPDHVLSYWRDEFIITGGTGRFEGASGGGMTDDYNSSLDSYSHHHWTGTITLKKGKEK